MVHGVVLSTVDVTVIAILWSTEFLNIWICSLCVYTSIVFFTPEQLQSDNFENNDVSVFAIQCLGALMIAFLVDVGRLRKMVVSIIGVSLFALTPFVSLFTTMSNSEWSGMIMFWPCSVLFITLPVTYCLMFNQKLNASSTQVRRIVAILEMGNALIGWITFISLPEELDRNSRYSVVFMWVITIPLLVTLLTLLERIRKFIRGDFTIDKSVKSVIEGIQRDLHQKHHRGRSVRHVVFFSLLLLPAMSLSVLGSTLDSVSNEDAQTPDPALVNLLFVFQMLTIPLIEVILAMTQLREDKADYSVLIIAHLTNVMVLVLIVMNMRVVSPVSSADDVEQKPFVRTKRGLATQIDIKLPQSGQAAFMILNGVDYDVELEPSVRFDDGPYKYTINPGQFVPGRTSASDSGLEVDFTFRIMESSIPSPPELKRTIRLTGDNFHVFILIGNNTFLDLVHSIHVVQLLKLSKILIVNTMAEHIKEGKVQITPDDGSFSELVNVPPAQEIRQVEVPAVITTKFYYRYTGKDEAGKERYKDDKAPAYLEGYEVYVVYLFFGGHPPKMNINTVRVFHGSPPTPPPRTTMPPSSSMATTTFPSSPTTQPPPTTRKPPKRDPPTPQQITAYSMAGAALGTTSVAYTHFFWMESPLRLRTTMFAAFRVAGEVVYKLTPVLTGEGLTLTKAYALLSLQVCTTIAHLVLGWIFQTKIHPT